MEFKGKQIVGIDMASKKFDACFKERGIKGKTVVKGTRSFGNDLEGFGAYMAWCAKRRKADGPVHLVEATGIYHENLCYYLHGHGERVSVQLAQKAKYFIKSLNIKTKTDKVDASALAEMGLSRPLEPWRPVSKEFRAIRDLSRTLARLKDYSVMTGSQLHALNASEHSSGRSIEIMEALHGTQKELIVATEREILVLVSKDPDLYGRIERITRIKGIGTLTVVKLLAETDGFRNVKSIRGLVSYAGLDVVQDQSGMHRGRSKISKKGNGHIRTALYMPAMTATRYDPKSKKFYERLNERLPKKRQSLIAVMRKLLITIYTLWKNGEDYDPDHQWQKQGRDLGPVTG